MPTYRIGPTRHGIGSASSLSDNARDREQRLAQARARQRENARGTAMLTPSRVYDALNGEVGTDYKREPTAQTIVWDAKLCRYRRATFIDIPTPVSKQAKLVAIKPNGGNRHGSGSL